MKKIYMKWWAWGVVVVLIIGGLFLFGSEKNPSYDFDKKQSDLYQQELSNLVEKQKQDTYGGDTPQETWDMFVSALEDGDTDLASKYFVVEKQEEMRENFEVGKKNDSINDFLQLIKKNSTSGYYKNLTDRYYITLIENNSAFMTFNFILNKYTNKWKIESL